MRRSLGAKSDILKILLEKKIGGFFDKSVKKTF